MFAKFVSATWGEETGAEADSEVIYVLFVGLFIAAMSRSLFAEAMSVQIQVEIARDDAHPQDGLRCAIMSEKGFIVSI